MFMNYWKGFTCIALFSTLAACGGDSSGDGNGPGGQACNAATTSDPYLPTSYDSCNASDDSLVGLWMVVADYHITSDGVERNKQQRSVMAITENDNGLNAFVCNEELIYRSVDFASTDSVLELYDDRAEAPLDLVIKSNTLMEGEYLGFESSVEVESSSVTAIKISDSIMQGSLDLDYVMEGFSFSEDDIPVVCFLQAKGTSYIAEHDLSWDAEYLYFFTNVDNNGTNEEILISVGVPTDPEDGPDIDLDFDESFISFNSENPENSTITYVENSNTGVVLDVDAVDDFDADESASFTLDWGW